MSRNQKIDRFRTLKTKKKILYLLACERCEIFPLTMSSNEINEEHGQVQVYLLSKR